VDIDGHILGIMGPIWRKNLQRTAQIHQNHYILTTIGPRDLEFHPIWLYDMPKCFVYTDGHFLGIIIYGTNLEEKVICCKIPLFALICCKIPLLVVKSYYLPSFAVKSYYLPSFGIKSYYLHSFAVKSY
jgi:hypothetical protein